MSTRNFAPLFLRMRQKFFSVQFLNLHAIKVMKSFQPNRAVARYFWSSVVPSLFLVKALTETEERGLAIFDYPRSVIKEADVLYDEGEYEKLYNLLVQHQTSDKSEILWRLARALFEKCRPFDKDQKLKALEEALSLVEKALEMDDNCWAAHKWRAILLDYVWRYKSTKGRIIHSFEVKTHMERAVQLNPTDATSFYLLGEWCFTFADMPWYQRKVAATLFASPPTSTYEEALKYFERAEEISPLFYSMNLLMLGKCYLRLNQRDKAALFLKKIMDYPVKTADDQQAHEEAEKLLKGMQI